MILQGALLAVGLLFVLWRRPYQGMRLRLKSSLKSKLIASQTPYVPRRSGGRKPPMPSTLNVHFNYNGHDFDAYQVLGIPAGSSLENVEIAFRQALEKSDPASREFLEAALRAIQGHLGMLSA